MKNKEETKKKVKLSTAKKRDKQNEKKALRNRMFLSKVRTFLRSLPQSVSNEKKGENVQLVQRAYSLLDRAQMRGIFKKNKSARMKSSLAKRML